MSEIYGLHSVLRQYLAEGPANVIARHRQAIFCLQGLSGSVLRLFQVTGVLALFEAGDRGQKVS